MDNLENTQDIDLPTNSPEAGAGAMPPGFDSQDSTMSPAELRKLQLITYSLSALGVVLLPVAFLLRAGRWSMRTLMCHHRGWEFGGF